MSRITSNQTDDSECKPILAQYTAPRYDTTASISPSVKSSSGMSNDKISVHSNTSKASKSSKISHSTNNSRKSSSPQQFNNNINDHTVSNSASTVGSSSGNSQKVTINYTKYQ
eukprot:TRINITY_DN21548_c0_g1_i1.p1 TRINITY_DN21548_c0_g1~~TRINITY_DN21548_c0_g1_i1.p1  ORF type:complete len:113 (-),score=6.14 TRINITY_DN21548_c0_g1_i1:88-426(-)